jgi:hypothetical protein
MRNHLKRLHLTLAALAPIHGVSGTAGTATIQFRPEATAQQQADAQAALAAFDWSDAAHDTWLANRVPERRDLRTEAAQAVTDNNTYLALGSPSNAQNLAQIRALTRQNNRIIRRLVQLD